MPTDDLARRLAAAGQLEAARQKLDAWSGQLENVPHWQPARGLLAQCGEARQMLDALQDRLQQKLVVTLIGPSGSGKSTLLNALAGADHLSPTGHRRPTTRKAVVFCAKPEDVENLVQAVGREHVELVSSPAAATLDHAVLVDTPDTDSEMLPEHRPVLERLARHSDVLLCVLNAENPKRRDNLDFLRPLVDLFPHESLYVLLSHCDRQPRQELLDDVLPDLRAHIKATWGREPQRIFCVSGRRHLTNPAWDEGAQPLHDFDEFDELRRTLFETLNRGSVVVDARLKQAERIESLVAAAISARIESEKPQLEAAEASFHQINQQALGEAVDALRALDTQTSLGVDLMLYQRLAQLWWGPIGWLLALWARLLLFGSGLFNVLRFGNPIGQLYGVVSTAMRYWKTGQAIEEASSNRTIQKALDRYRSVVAHHWPDEGKKLAAAGFDNRVIDPQYAWQSDGPLSRRIGGMWESELNSAIEAKAQSLSNFFLQFVANLPVVGIMGLVAYQCLDAYRRSEFLSGDYFRHALVTIVIVWLLSFMVVQIIIRIGGGKRLLKNTINRMLKLAAEDRTAAVQGGLSQEVRTLLQLGEDASLNS